MAHYVKNVDFAKPVDFRELVVYQEGQVVSRTLAQGKPVSVTLFAFAQGEEISSHASSGDAIVQVLDGRYPPCLICEGSFQDDFNRHIHPGLDKIKAYKRIKLIADLVAKRRQMNYNLIG